MSSHVFGRARYEPSRAEPLYFIGVNISAAVSVFPARQRPVPPASLQIRAARIGRFQQAGIISQTDQGPKTKAAQRNPPNGLRPQCKDVIVGRAANPFICDLARLFTRIFEQIHSQSGRAMSARVLPRFDREVRRRPDRSDHTNGQGPSQNLGQETLTPFAVCELHGTPPPNPGHQGMPKRARKGRFCLQRCF